MSVELLSRTEGASLILSLSNPGQRNALGPAMYGAGLAAMEAAAADSSVRSIVLTGAGTDFCAGGQLQRLQANRSLAPSVQASSIDALHAWIEAIRHCPKPVVAAVEGAAAGAGFSLMLACDMAVASSNAVFVMAYGNVGLSPDGGASWHLGQQLPRALATELLMCGPRLTAQQLLAHGLINRVSEPGGALAGALALASTLNQRAPNANTSVKQLLQATQGPQFSAHLARERDHFVANLHHANAGIGIDAFLSKRPAQFESNAPARATR